MVQPRRQDVVTQYQTQPEHLAEQETKTINDNTRLKTEKREEDKKKMQEKGDIIVESRLFPVIRPMRKRPSSVVQWLKQTKKQKTCSEINN
ncbi:hypothetical protein COCSADRAFT_234669 [Bipolaris sorokiniana ND90Pr]|uniref:Uncharacterized protein n=1 Tax=Cochliobolus sativus (strain ND90Pr / ATCC 201652) TaxID=665912 RepID=M2SH27_COCSN|nr:uncharacterized protein COCSADRAFT_234669 [Bipolaris sorokiniana ND90Pr]EMD61710.1 hypothetical protein COCSADRAFT_234669 [Bipolaris sorokiniana ND90Pr]